MSSYGNYLIEFYERNMASLVIPLYTNLESGRSRMCNYVIDYSLLSGFTQQVPTLFSLILRNRALISTQQLLRSLIISVKNQIGFLF